MAEESSGEIKQAAGKDFIQKKKLQLGELIIRVREFLKKSTLHDQRVKYREESFLNRANVDLVHKEEGFDINTAFQNTKGQWVEVAGPTSSGYWFGSKLIETESSDRKVFISNLHRGAPIFKGDKIVSYYGKVDFQADSTQLPLKDGSVGALFGSCLEKNTREKTFREAGRVLEEGGLFVYQGGSYEDMETGLQNNLSVKECWKESSKNPLQNARYNIIFQKGSNSNNSPSPANSVSSVTIQSP